MKLNLFFIGFLLISVVLVSGCIQQSQTTTTTTTEIPTTTIKEVETTTTAVSTSGEVKTFDVTAKQWEFVPNPIQVKKGDKVRLNIVSADVPHGFALPEYGINEKIDPGKTTVIEFTADKAGTFTFFCSIPCGSGHTSMKGQLIVSD